MEKISHKKTKSLSIATLEQLSPVKPSKKSGLLPPIMTLNSINEDKLGNDGEDFRDEAFSKKKNTIKTFLKNTDLKIMSLNAKETKKSLNLIRKNTSIEFVNLSKKMFENALDVKKEKGSLKVNELWSHNYYKKVMKYSNLKQIMDKILKSKRMRVKENKQKILSRNELDYQKAMEKLSPLNLSEPKRKQKENSSNGRRSAVDYEGENLVEKRKSISLIESDIGLNDSFNKNKKMRRVVYSNAKKYISEILKTCDSYDKEVKDFDKYICQFLSYKYENKKANQLQRLESTRNNAQTSLKETLCLYFETKSKKQEALANKKLGPLKI